MFRVMQEDTSKEARDKIVKRCINLMHSYSPYDLIYTNCESAAFTLTNLKEGHEETIEGLTRGSPQVPMGFYFLLRVTLGLFGIICLLHMPSKYDDDAEEGESIRWKVAMFSVDYYLVNIFYHILFTTVSVLNATMYLVRVTVHLTGATRIS